MRVLVTGAGGFLGRYVVEELLRRGHAVRGLGRSRYPALESAGVEMRQVDIRDAAAVAEALAGMEGVIHTAAVAGIWGPKSHYFSINAEGTANVLAGCRLQGVPRLVYSSSPSVTFRAADQSGVDESTPYSDRFLCHYPHSKAVAEQAVLAADGATLRTCALRPHLIWGPRDPHLVPRLLQRGRAGQLRQVGAGQNRVDMIYVANAAVAHVQALEALDRGPPRGRAYFLSQGEPVNCWQWINQLLELGGVAPVQRSISFRSAWRVGGVLEFMWRAAGWQSEPRMTRFLAAQLAKDHYFDITAACRDFEFRPQISTSEGMERLAAWISQGMPD